MVLTALLCFIDTVANIGGTFDAINFEYIAAPGCLIKN